MPKTAEQEFQEILKQSDVSSEARNFFKGVFFGGEVHFHGKDDNSLMTAFDPVRAFFDRRQKTDNKAIMDQKMMNLSALRNLDSRLKFDPTAPNNDPNATAYKEGMSRLGYALLNNEEYGGLFRHPDFDKDLIDKTVKVALNAFELQTLRQFHDPAPEGYDHKKAIKALDNYYISKRMFEKSTTLREMVSQKDLERAERLIMQDERLKGVVESTADTKSEHEDKEFLSKYLNNLPKDHSNQILRIGQMFQDLSRVDAQKKFTEAFGKKEDAIQLATEVVGKNKDIAPKNKDGAIVGFTRTMMHLVLVEGGKTISPQDKAEIIGEGAAITLARQTLGKNGAVNSGIVKARSVIVEGFSNGKRALLNIPAYKALDKLFTEAVNSSVVESPKNQSASSSRKPSYLPSLGSPSVSSARALRIVTSALGISSKQVSSLSEIEEQSDDVPQVKNPQPVSGPTSPSQGIVPATEVGVKKQQLPAITEEETTVFPSNPERHPTIPERRPTIPERRPTIKPISGVKDLSKKESLLRKEMMKKKGSFAKREEERRASVDTKQTTH
ncbi:MAG: hypothetical protein ACJA0S_000903 [Rickettsiales bacterium]|jgi:hypothetical protein